MKRMRKAMAAAVVVLAAVSASAQETDAETRFHRAYEQEVVDGKVADAAREYLAMMGDEKFPERLRLEAKFRFAVTTMLLGRADEARVHFGAIAADAKAPEALRARATEYLDAAKGVGVGNEIDKKLQSLVFDLAKDKEPTPAAYRDFQVIGKRAVPFLRQLLQHQDLALRVHAYRILLGMGEPGMVDVWTPELTKYGYPQMALNQYLAERPDDRAAFERRLLALDDETVGSVLGAQSYIRPQYSAATLRALAARKIPPAVLVANFPANGTEEIEQVRGEWITGGDAKLSEEATLSYLYFVQGLQPGVAVRGDLFPPIVARLATMPLWTLPPYPGSGAKYSVGVLVTKGLTRLAIAVPPETLLDTLANVVERGVAAPAGDSNPLQSALVNALATVVEMREPDAPLPVRLGDVLKVWFAEMSKRGQGVEPPVFAWHVKTAAERMPPDAATALAVWAVTTPLTGADPAEVAQAVPMSRVRDVPVAMAALRAADVPVRQALLGLMTGITKTPQPEYAREVLRVLPEIVRACTAVYPEAGLDGILKSFVVYAQTLPTEEARDRLVETAEAVAAHTNSGVRHQALASHLLGFSVAGGRTAYWTEVALPALERVWPKLDQTDHAFLLDDVLRLLVQGPRDATLRGAVGRLVAAHYGDVPAGSAYRLADAPDVFELTDWVPKVCPETGVSDDATRVPSERADPAVRAMTADPNAVNAAVLAFVMKSASPAVQKETADRLIRGASGERLRLMLWMIFAASPETLEDALARTMAEPSPDVNVVAVLVQRLADVRPSENLFPAVRLLIRSRAWLTGVATAKALGREELLPDLAALLESMDLSARNVAKDAIDSIVALRKLRDEARRSAGGGK